MKTRLSPAVARLKSYAGWLLVALIMGYLAHVIIANRDSLTALTIQPAHLAVHVALIGAYFSLLLLAWVIVVRGTAMSVSGGQAALIWLLANAGKYVPGKVLMIGGRVILLQRAGCRIADTVMATTIEHMMLLFAALPLTLYGISLGIRVPSLVAYALVALASLALLTLVLWPTALTSLANRALRWAQRPPLSAPIDRLQLLQLLGLYFLAWLCYGVSAVAIVHAVGLANVIPMTFLLGISVAAWTIGFFAIITPGGLGVREAVFAGFLVQYVSQAEAVACALLFRLTWTMVEWAGVALGAGLSWRKPEREI